MKILMQIRANIFTCPGGDTIQMQKTKVALEKIGCNVDLSLELRPNLSDYDVIHLFNITRVQETFIQVQNAVEQKKPIVLSTIYWPFNDFEKKANIGIRKILGKFFDADKMASIKALAKYLLLREKDEGTKYLIHHKYSEMQQYILRNTNIFLPNALGEMEQIKKHLKFFADLEDIVIVPNAIDLEIAEKALKEKTDKFVKYKGWLICVGRIDARKNQLKLLEAISGSDYKLLLVGKCSPGQKNYYKKVMRCIKDNPNVEYIEQISNDDLYQLYKECRVSVLPSWFETPGLVSLEAAVMGCNIVVSDKGTTKEYFGSYAFYCDVMDSNSIREQIDLAYCTVYDKNFRFKIMTEYTWEKAALATYRGYKAALQ